MSRLFSYILRYDDGAAPNPFNNMCSLAICKPKIRSVASIGDWVVGLGSKPSGKSGYLIYAMYVERVLPMKDYDQQAIACWRHRIPDTKSYALQDHLGDCIYDYSTIISNRPKQRSSVHGNGKDIDSGTVDIDLGGKNVLLSFNKFYYFGNQAIKLPPQLEGINPHVNNQNQGHRSNSNNDYFKDFEKWIANQKSGQNGWPDHYNSCGVCVPHINNDQNSEIDECIKNDEHLEFESDVKVTE